MEIHDSPSVLFSMFFSLFFCQSIFFCCIACNNWYQNQHSFTYSRDHKQSLNFFLKEIPSKTVESCLESTMCSSNCNKQGMFYRTRSTSKWNQSMINWQLNRKHKTVPMLSWKNSSLDWVSKLCTWQIGNKTLAPMEVTVCLNFLEYIFRSLRGMMGRVGFINVNSFLRWILSWKIGRLKSPQYIWWEGVNLASIIHEKGDGWEWNNIGGIQIGYINRGVRRSRTGPDRGLEKINAWDRGPDRFRDGLDRGRTRTGPWRNRFGPHNPQFLDFWASFFQFLLCNLFYNAKLPINLQLKGPLR